MVVVLLVYASKSIDLSYGSRETLGTLGKLARSVVLYKCSKDYTSGDLDAIDG